MNIDDINSCGECTECCTGALHANIYGHQMKPGTPCFFLNKLEVHNCSIYGNRPSFCASYKCEWLKQANWPKNLQPKVCGIIVDTHVSRVKKYIASGKPDTVTFDYRVFYTRLNVLQKDIDIIKSILGNAKITQFFNDKKIDLMGIEEQNKSNKKE